MVVRGAELFLSYLFMHRSSLVMYMSLNNIITQNITEQNRTELLLAALSGCWWFLMFFGGSWWFLVVLGDSWRFLSVLDGFMLFFGVSLRFLGVLLVFGCSWWLLEVLSGSWWFLLILGCSW